MIKKIILLLLIIGIVFSSGVYAESLSDKYDKLIEDTNYQCDKIIKLNTGSLMENAWAIEIETGNWNNAWRNKLNEVKDEHFDTVWFHEYYQVGNISLWSYYNGELYDPKICFDKAANKSRHCVKSIKDDLEYINGLENKSIKLTCVFDYGRHVAYTKGNAPTKQQMNIFFLNHFKPPYTEFVKMISIWDDIDLFDLWLNQTITLNYNFGKVTYHNESMGGTYYY